MGALLSKSDFGVKLRNEKSVLWWRKLSLLICFHAQIDGRVWRRREL